MSPDYSWLFLKMIALLGIIVILGFVLFRYVGPTGRLRKKGAGRNLRIVEAYQLGPKRAVYLVRIGKRLFALGAGESQLNLISELHETDLEP